MSSAVPTRWIPIAAGGVAAFLSGGAFLYQVFHVSYQQQTNTAAIAALRSDVEKLEAASVSADATIKAMQRDLNELETEICAEDDLRNLMHAAELRDLAMLYEKIEGRSYQIGNAFYPQVCRRTSTGKP